MSTRTAPEIVQSPPDAASSDYGPTLSFGMLAIYLTLIILGFLIIRFGGIAQAGNEMSLRRSLFTSVNAATLTGFQQSIAIDELAADSRGAPITLLALTLAGTLFSLIVGGMAVVRIVRIAFSDAQVIVGAFVVTILALLAGSAALMSRERGLFDAVFQAASAFGNSGLTIGVLSGVGKPQTHFVLLPLAFAGGLGLPVLMQLYSRAIGGPSLSVHSRTVIASSLALYVAGTLLFSILLWPHKDLEKPAGAAADWRNALESASAASLNSRTAGLPFEYVNAMPRTMQWALLVFMLIGASPGGTGGGVKTTALVRLTDGAVRALRRRPVSRGFGIAIVWLALYLFITLAGFLLLLSSEPDVPADRLFFLAFSAVSNVGLSHDAVSIAGNGLLTMCIMMLLGRLVPLAILWWMASTARREDLAIG